jgi:RNA polymerase sigma-70 factor (ECF subfamily)
MLPDHGQTDQQLAREAQAGSLEAFEVLVTRYESRVLSFVRRLCPSQADDVEITQETFVKAFRALDQYDPERSFAAWLFTIARRKCMDHLRALPPPAEETREDIPSAADVFETVVRADEQSNIWELARQKLPPALFQVLWLTYAEDFSVAETAQVMRLTRTHVKVLLFRARGRLKKLLSQPRALISQFDAPSRSRGTVPGAI